MPAPHTRYPSLSDYIVPNTAMPIFKTGERRFNLGDEVGYSHKALKERGLQHDRTMRDLRGLITEVPGCMPEYPNHYEVLFPSGKIHRLSASALVVKRRAKAWVPMYQR